MAPSNPISNALDVDDDDVERFAAAHLPAPPARVLEVGGGDGRVAARLAARGFSVKLVDLDDEAVAAARARGVDAECADYFDVRGDFDAVLFTRSFHHLFPLARAVEQARRLGRVLVFDEFTHDECDAATAAWFFDAHALLDAAGALAKEFHRGHHHHHHHHGDEPKAPLERWRERHAHEPPLHGGRAMLDALGGAFEVRHVERRAYLHRYLAERVSPDVFRRARSLEEERIEQRLIVPVGLRVVAAAR